jgi:nucleotide-binding universal stress UspA family protein
VTRIGDCYDYVVPGLLDFIDKNSIDQVVMSTHGANDMYEFFVGSTAEKVVQLSSAPVISITQATTLASIKNILLPNTLELDQHDLMNDLQSLQHLLGATLHILLINTPRDFYDEQQGRERLERFATHYNFHDFTLNFRSNRVERSGIIKFMGEVKADMIAMATHGRTGLAHILKGSVAEDVLTLIDCPL